MVPSHIMTSAYRLIPYVYSLVFCTSFYTSYLITCTIITITTIITPGKLIEHINYNTTHKYRTSKLDKLDESMNFYKGSATKPHQLSWIHN